MNLKKLTARVIIASTIIIITPLIALSYFFTGNCLTFNKEDLFYKLDVWSKKNEVKKYLDMSDEDFKSKITGK